MGICLCVSVSLWPGDSRCFCQLRCSNQRHTESPGLTVGGCSLVKAESHTLWNSCLLVSRWRERGREREGEREREREGGRE